MLVYLDACSLQRPLDDRSQLRINLEAEAVLTVLRMAESGRLELLSSEVLAFELDRIPDQYRKLQAAKMLELAVRVIELNDEIEAQADGFIRAGVRPIDALHLGCASWAKADYFCTCDDRLLKTSNKLKTLATEVVSPLRLAAEVTP